MYRMPLDIVPMDPYIRDVDYAVAGPINCGHVTMIKTALRPLRQLSVWKMLSCSDKSDDETGRLMRYLCRFREVGLLVTGIASPIGLSGCYWISRCMKYNVNEDMLWKQHGGFPYVWERREMIYKSEGRPFCRGIDLILHRFSRLASSPIIRFLGYRKLKMEERMTACWIWKKGLQLSILRVGVMVFIPFVQHAYLRHPLALLIQALAIIEARLSIKQGIIFYVNGCVAQTFANLVHEVSRVLKDDLLDARVERSVIECHRPLDDGKDNHVKGSNCGAGGLSKIESNVRDISSVNVSLRENRVRSRKKRVLNGCRKENITDPIIEGSSREDSLRAMYSRYSDQVLGDEYVFRMDDLSYDRYRKRIAEKLLRNQRKREIRQRKSGQTEKFNDCRVEYLRKGLAAATTPNQLLLSELLGGDGSYELELLRMEDPSPVNRTGLWTGVIRFKGYECSKRMYMCPKDALIDDLVCRAIATLFAVQRERILEEIDLEINNSSVGQDLVASLGLW